GQRAHSGCCETMRLHDLVVPELAELSGVPVGRDHQMTGGVRELVQQRERGPAAVDDEAVLVAAVERQAKDAALLLVGAAHILEPPRSPERSGHAEASIRSRRQPTLLWS